MNVPPVIISPQIEVIIRRCFSCGRYYGHEAIGENSCPTCAKSYSSERNGLIDRLERSNASLRGVIKRMKGGAK